jgi:SAM-dependent methyltransferase
MIDDFKFKNNLYKKNKCVLCSSNKLNLILNFGKTPLANSFLKKKIKQKLFKLQIVICQKCKHVQLKHIVNPDLMFKHYLYVSGTSKVLLDHFEHYSQKIISRFDLKKKDSILDIACNDGTFLNCFKKKKFNKLIGVDPAKNLKIYNKSKSIIIENFFFNTQTSNKLKKKYGKFKVITANNVCAHTPYLNNFFCGVFNLLDREGVFVFEVSYLLDVIKKRTFDTMYHEHMSYHSLLPLINFVKKNGLEIFDFDLVEAQGGSIRIYVGHKKMQIIKKNKINKQIQKEKLAGIYKNNTYTAYYNEILKNKIRLRNAINFFKKKKYKIVGYGAPAKLTTFSYVFNITSKDMDFIIDDNPLKQKRFTPGTNIQIINFNKSLKMMKNKKIVVFILAWNFYNSIKKRCQNILGKKISFVKPFPKIIIEKI